MKKGKKVISVENFNIGYNAIYQAAKECIKNTNAPFKKGYKGNN